MRRKFMLVFSVLFVMFGVCLHLSAEVGEVSGSGEGVGPDETVSISLSNPYGTSITKIPKDDSYFIHAMWTTPINGYKATFIVAGVDQGSGIKSTHIIIKESTSSGIIGTACCTAIAPWVDSGQSVPIIVKVDVIGTGFKLFQVE